MAYSFGLQRARPSMESFSAQSRRESQFTRADVDRANGTRVLRKPPVTLEGTHARRDADAIRSQSPERCVVGSAEAEREFRRHSQSSHWQLD